MIRKLLDKSRRPLATARLDLQSGDSDASVNRSYYAAFYAAWALFESAGVEKPKKHSGLIGEFGRHFVKNGPLDSNLGIALARLENLRNYADYVLEDTPTDKAESALESAEAFVEAIASYISEQQR